MPKIKPSEPSRHPVLVVIGGGEGGMLSLERFFQAIHVDTEAAFVVIQKVDECTDETRRNRLAKFSPLPLRTLTEPMRLEAGHVVVAPPDCQVTLNQGVLAPIPGPIGQVIDNSFRELAENHKAPVVGIILSGSGCDGARGLKAIADAGGLTMVEAIESANFPEMPQEAQQAGCADHVLLPQRMPGELASYLSVMSSGDEVSEVDEMLAHNLRAVVPRICDALRDATGHDFRHYKSSTLIRRIARRMHVLRLTSPDAYLDALVDSKDESLSLFRELLVSVTSFFRDPDTFAYLADNVIGKLFDKDDPAEPIRVWVPGCATGEEAYSLAILLHEERERRGVAREIQIFATDIDESALQVARSGVYPLSIAGEVSPERLKHFFTKKNNQYFVSKPLRECCVFTTHSLVSDPPYSRMDLVSCRNVLIYFGSHLQQKLISLFHFAIRPHGYLLLGPSENLASHAEIFRTLDQKHRISQRKAAPAHTATMVSMGNPTTRADDPEKETEVSDSDVHRIAQRIVLDEFAPRWVVINEDALLICSSANLEMIFEFPEGPFRSNVIKLARQGLRSGLRSAFRESAKLLETIVRDDLMVKTGDGTRRIKLTVQPMPDMGDDGKLFMLVFQDQGFANPRHHESTLASPDAEQIIEQLEAEVEKARNDLEQTVQDLESSNEEMKSSNEELRSLNEELQSANEELESSKEEIESGMVALDHANLDLENLLDGTQIPTIFIDADGNVKRFTPTVREIYLVRDTDIGRPLSEIAHVACRMPPLPALSDVPYGSQPIEHEIATDDGRCYLRRVLPYRRRSQVAGLIVTFVDVSQQKRTADRLAAAHAVTGLLATADSFSQVASQILDAVRTCLDADICALWLPDVTDQELLCSEICVGDREQELQPFIETSRSLRLRRGQGTLGRAWETGQTESIENLNDPNGFVRKDQAAHAGFVSGMAIPIVSRNDTVGVIEFFADRILEDRDSLLELFREVCHEIGQFIHQNRLRDELDDEEARKAAILEASVDCIVTMDVAGNVVDFNPAAERTFGYSREEAVGRRMADLIIPERFREAHARGTRSYLETGKGNVIGERVELIGMRRDGSEFPIELALNVAMPREGAPFFTGYIRDITQRKESEARQLALLHESQSDKAKLQVFFDQNRYFAGILDLNGTTTSVNQTALVQCGYAEHEVIGRLFWETPYWSGDAEVQEKIRKGFQLALRGETFHEEVSFWTADGSQRVSDFTFTPVRNPDGEIIYIVPTGSDITDRRRSQLREKREANIQLFLAEATAALNSSLDYKKTSQQVADLCVPTIADWAMIDLIGRSNRRRRVAIANANPDEGELAVRLKRFATDSAWRESLGQQSLVGTQGLLISKPVADFGALLQLPPAHSKLLQEANLHSLIVVPLVARQTTFGVLILATSDSAREYDQRDLKVAQELASRVASAVDIARLYEESKRANVAKSEFVANMSHEIRTPMTAILGYTDILAAKIDDPDSAEHLETIRRNGHFLLEIINDILDLSKIEAGKMDVTREWCEPQQVVEDVESLMDVRAKECGLEFSVSFDGPIPASIESDPKRLRQIIVNLVGNAIKFTDSGSVRLVVRFIDSASPMMVFEVIDTGIGLSPEQIGKLFKSFSQADSSISRSFGGTGLGLAISQRLAHMLGGKITVESELGEGSTFRCEIEAGDVSDVARIRPRSDAPLSHSPTSGDDHHPLCGRILVVDDRRDVRFLSGHLLKKFGAHVEFAEDGVEAVERVSEMLKNGPLVDLILLDMQMPRLDGYQTATKLRELGFGKPIIALTADAMHGDMNRCIESGCNAYLSKPIDAAELNQMVFRMLNEPPE